MTVYAADNAAIQYIGRYTDVSGERRLTGGKTCAMFRIFGRTDTSCCLLVVNTSHLNSVNKGL